MKEEKPKRKRSKAKPKVELITTSTSATKEPILPSERVIMGKGVAALNKALYEQSIHEANRLSRLRGLIGILEDELITEDKIKELDEEGKRRLLNSLKRDSQFSVGFLERMQHSSLQLMLMLDVYKQLMEQVSMEEEEGTGSTEIDKAKVSVVRDMLLSKLKKGE